MYKVPVMASRISHQRVITILNPSLLKYTNVQACCWRPLSTSSVYHAVKRKPVNTIINFVPQQEAWVVERFGRYLRTLKPGLNLLFPIIDDIKYVQSLKEVAIDIPSQSAISEDNVTLHLDGVLYMRIYDPYAASYGVEDAEFAVTQLAQTTMRSELGKIKLDRVFQERTHLNVSIVEAINIAAEAWGVKCLRYEIKDIQLPTKVKEAMQMQVEAERKKRAVVLESEGVRESAINKAEGYKQSKILASEAKKVEQINIAKGAALATIAKAEARARALRVVGDVIGMTNGSQAASLTVAEQYVEAFSKLAKTSNTLMLPENTGNVASMVSQAMAIYGHMNKKQPPQDDQDPPPDKTDKEEVPLKEIEVDETISSLLQEAEDVVKSTEKGITEETSGTKEISHSTQESEQHFTIANSPTRFQHHKDTTTTKG